MMKTKPPDITKLVDLVARLRAPDGCPWDQKQTLADVRAYLLEEAHEVAAEIDSGDMEALAGELGDLIFQAVFIAHLGGEQGAFNLADAIDRIHRKMIDRHPHVFGDSQLSTSAEVVQTWERRKLAATAGERSLLDGLPRSLPALVASYRMTQKAAGVGFDWPDLTGVLSKVREELAEVEEALVITDGESRQEAVAEEIGDLLFAIANLARHCGQDPEAALARSNRKFRRRFAALEEIFVAADRNLGEASLEEMDAVWEQVKAREKETGRGAA